MVIGAEAGARLEGKHRKARAHVERAVSSARADDFDALVIPGGGSPAVLRLDPAIVPFVRDGVRGWAGSRRACWSWCGARRP